MKVLLLTQWYPPEPYKLFSDLAQSLKIMGHTPSVLTGFPNYPNGKIYPPYKLRLWQKDRIEDIPVTRVILYPEHSRSAVRRILNYLSFASSSTLLGPWLLNRPDVIFVHCTPYIVAIPAWIMSRIWRVPFVFNVQDLWPETLQATGMMKNRRALRVVGRFADWVYRRAVAIVVISPGFRNNLIAKGVPKEKIHVISNWVDVTHFRPLPPNMETAAKLGLEGKFNVMFAGSMGTVQGLETVLEAAALLRQHAEIQFVLVGGGVERERLKARTCEMSLENVLFPGQFPEGDMPKYFALADVLLVHLCDDPLFRITIPHKIFAYMASAKPIIAAVTGDAAEIVVGAQAGVACPPNDPKALADTVYKVYLMSAEERKSMALAGRRVACERYSREYLVGQIANVLRSVAVNSTA